MGKQSKPPKIAFPSPIFLDLAGSRNFYDSNKTLDPRSYKRREWIALGNRQHVQKSQIFS